MDNLFSGENLWFTAPAVAASAFFLIRLIMLAFGGLGDGDAATDAGMDVSGDPHGAAHHGDPGLAAQFLSVQGVTTFLMGFGWTGYAALAGFGAHPGTASVLGIIGGALLTLLLGTLFRGVRRLEASGTLDLADAVGIECEVYANVPPRGQGAGQVRLVIQQRQRIVNAVSDAGALPTRSRVRVVRVNADRTVTVQTA